MSAPDQPPKRPNENDGNGAVTTKRVRVEAAGGAAAAASLLTPPATTLTTDSASLATATWTHSASPAVTLMTTTAQTHNAVQTHAGPSTNPQELLGAVLSQLDANGKVAVWQLLRENDQQLLAKEQELRAKEQELRAKDQQLLAKEQELRAKDQELRAKDQQLLLEKDLRLSEKDLKDRQLSEKDQELDELRQTNEQRDFVKDVTFLSEIGSSTNASFVQRFVTQFCNDDLQTDLNRFQLPHLSNLAALEQELDKVRNLVNSSTMNQSTVNSSTMNQSTVNSTFRETSMHWAVADYCQAVCEQVGAKLNFHAHNSTLSAPDVFSSTWAVDRSRPASRTSTSTVASGVTLPFVPPTAPTRLGTSRQFGSVRLSELLIDSRVFVEVKKGSTDVQAARLQVGSYLVHYHLTGSEKNFNARQVASWPAFLYGLVWCGVDYVSVARVDLKLGGKLIAPKVTFATTPEPARAVLFVVWQAILAYNASVANNAPSDSSDPRSWDCNFGFTPRAANPGAAAPGQPDNAAGGGALAGASGGNVVATDSIVLNLTTGPQPLLDAQVFHRDFMFTGKLRLNSSEEFTNVVVKVAAANRKALTEQLAREGMALALLNRDRMQAAAHGIPELLSFCTVTLGGTPGLALVTGLIPGHSVDWQQHQPYAASIASQVCDTLRWIHAQGVVHGDIHRGNLLVTETKLPLTPPASPPKGALEPPPKGAVKLPPHSITLVDFGLSCFLPAVTREHVQAALLAAPVTVAAAQELQPWLGHVEANSWSQWPGHFYNIARSERVATPQADFLGLGLLVVSLEIGGTQVLKQWVRLDDSEDTATRTPRLRRFLRDQYQLRSLLARRTATLTEVQKIVALADGDVSIPPAPV
ncbi:hypothetical protein CAOG_08563 [Capsaspora owczarzaki ATCC 30864]|uniref:hypothetical protein n=1 Tax=Capsaspora owczarzaki (strain ATCC 30864) TaxID=595528 RepID=UPI0003523BF6|nr:hypothetical protein CAOG_08563 [Capsaspora owczarzaki ATCC 30864]|eukprot:XP_011270145.1 hypothetical protein CAOG_08563 [Capsaspora owczarzaki ATCC 30864]